MYNLGLKSRYEDLPVCSFVKKIFINRAILHKISQKPNYTVDLKKTGTKRPENCRIFEGYNFCMIYPLYI